MFDQQFTQNQQYQALLNFVRAYYPQFVHLLPPTPMPQGQAQTVQANAGNGQQVQEIQFMTKQEIEAYVPRSYMPVALWDRDSQIIYLVRLDGPGRTVRETLKWEPCQLQETPPQSDGQFASKADLAALSGRLDSLIAALQGQTGNAAAPQEGPSHE